MGKSIGFTLAELLVVVAIIAVLVAVSIPIFAGQTEKAKNAVCEANRRSLLAAYRASEMSDIDKTVTDWVKTAAEECGGQASNNSVTGLCPEDGTYLVLAGEDGSVTITCSVHGDIGGTYANLIADGILSDLDQMRTGDNKTLAQYLASKNQSGYRQIDSEAPEAKPNESPTWTSIIEGKIGSIKNSQTWMLKAKIENNEVVGYVLYVTTDGKATAVSDSVNTTKYTYDTSGKLTGTATNTKVKTENYQNKYIRLIED